MSRWVSLYLGRVRVRVKVRARFRVKVGDEVRVSFKVRGQWSGSGSGVDGSSSYQALAKASLNAPSSLAKRCEFARSLGSTSAYYGYTYYGYTYYGYTCEIAR